MTGSGIEGYAPSRFPGLTEIGVVVVLALAGMTAAASAQTPSAQPSASPTSLLPSANSDAKAAAPAAPVQLPATTPPTDNPVQIQQLQSIDPSGYGTLDENHGGLPIGVWANTDRALAVKLISTIGPTTSRTLQGLTRRLLLSVSTPPAVPDGAKPDDAFLIARARALWSLGEMDDLAAFLQSLPLPSITPPLRRLRADTALLNGDTATACAEAGPLAEASATDPYPVELRVFCQFAAGQGNAASLGVDVLREQGTKDPYFFTLADALSSGSAPRGEITDPSPLILAMARIAKAQVAINGTTSPPVLRSIALVPGAPFDMRLTAGERAEALGALDTDTLRRLYESVPFTGDDIANAEAKAKDASPRSRALLLQAAERQTAPLGKAGLIARALASADGPGYFVEARLFAPQIASLQPTNDIALYVPPLTRALIAARQFDVARNWAGWLRAQAVADKSTAGAAAGITVLTRLAKLDDAPLSGEALEAWRNAAPNPPIGATANWAARRASLGLALLNAVGETLPPEAALMQIDSSGLTAAQVPPPGLAFGLDAAVQNKRIGEVVLFADLVAGDGNFTQLDVATIARLVMALRSAGFDDDGRAVALEAALANGV
ncbi:MAG TPA: hypothetical protein VGG27_00920 [Magnetospirillaceae bacterium]|jgi:hypothetical protein